MTRRSPAQRAFARIAIPLLVGLISACASTSRPPANDAGPAAARIVWHGTADEKAVAPGISESRENHTALVPLQLGLRFGVRLAVPDVQPRPKVIQAFWRPPAPGIKDPLTGTYQVEDLVETVTEKCLPICLLMYRFDSEKELVPGTWTLEIRGFAGPPIVQTFKVYKPLPPDATLALTTLSHDDAIALVQGSPFPAARRIASLRPTPKTSIRSLRMEVYGEFSETPTRSASFMEFRPLPGGFLYTHHTVTAKTGANSIEEAFINVYGAVNLVYWNAGRAKEGDVQRSVAGEVAVAEGQIFDPDSSFTAYESLGDGLPAALSCKPTRQFAASEIHPTFPGRATDFDCRASDDNLSKLWYVHDAQQYLVHEVTYKNQVLSRFKVLEVQLQPR